MALTSLITQYWNDDEKIFSSKASFNNKANSSYKLHSFRIELLYLNKSGNGLENPKKLMEYKSGINENKTGFSCLDDTNEENTISIDYTPLFSADNDVLKAFLKTLTDNLDNGFYILDFHEFVIEKIVQIVGEFRKNDEEIILLGLDIISYLSFLDDVNTSIGIQFQYLETLLDIISFSSNCKCIDRSMEIIHDVLFEKEHTCCLLDASKIIESTLSILKNIDMYENNREIGASAILLLSDGLSFFECSGTLLDESMHIIYEFLSSDKAHMRIPAIRAISTISYYQRKLSLTFFDGYIISKLIDRLIANDKSSYCMVFQALNNIAFHDPIDEVVLLSSTFCYCSTIDILDNENHFFKLVRSLLSLIKTSIDISHPDSSKAISYIHDNLNHIFNIYSNTSELPFKTQILAALSIASLISLNTEPILTSIPENLILFLLSIIQYSHEIPIITSLVTLSSHSHITRNNKFPLNEFKNILIEIQQSSTIQSTQSQIDAILNYLTDDG